MDAQRKRGAMKCSYGRHCLTAAVCLGAWRRGEGELVCPPSAGRSATGFYEASEAVFGMTGTFRGRKVEEPPSPRRQGAVKSDMPVNYARISAFLHL